MKKYTSEVKQSALAMMKTMGPKYTSATLKISDCTLHRWRREAELEAVISPPKLDVDEADVNVPPIVGTAEETDAFKEASPEQPPTQLSTSALDEAVATIAFLTQENARLVKIIKHLRSVIHGIAEVL